MNSHIPLTPEQHRLASDNAGLVWHAMKKLRNTSLDSDDRLSACGMALIHAARTFDESKGVFVQHYWRWARSILRSDSRRGLIRIPRRLKKKISFSRVFLEDIATEFSVEMDDIYCFLKYLLPRQAGIMHRLYIDGYSQVEIAESLGMTRANVSIIHKKSLARLRKFVK